MPRSSNQKMKSLYLKRILHEQTYENNPLNARMLCEKSVSYDVPANRKSIYDDVEALRLLGEDVEHIGGSKDGGYYMLPVGLSCRS